MAIHEHSIQSFHQELSSSRIGRRAQKIVAWLRLHGPATDREVKDGLGFADMNSVRPRITEAVEAGLILEVSERRCPVTGKTVRVVDLSLVA